MVFGALMNSEVFYPLSVDHRLRLFIFHDPIDKDVKGLIEGCFHKILVGIQLLFGFLPHDQARKDGPQDVNKGHEVNLFKRAAKHSVMICLGDHSHNFLTRFIEPVQNFWIDGSQCLIKLDMKDNSKNGGMPLI